MARISGSASIGHQRVHLGNARCLGDQQAARAQGLHGLRQRVVQVAHQVQQVEGQHGVVGACPNTGASASATAKLSCGTGWAASFSRAMAIIWLRDVGGQQAPGERRQAQRRGAGAAADLQHVLAGDSRLCTRRSVAS
jgi:hypothetical protein